VVYGSTGAHRPSAPVGGIARTGDDHGYWLVSFDGGVFSSGDARFGASMGDQVLHVPVIGIAADPTGSG
jgi:hypothetical protein